MANCAVEYRDSALTTEECPSDQAKILIVEPAKYTFKTWKTLINCIISKIEDSMASDDEDVIITAAWAGRNYYDMPALKNVRFRLFRDGILLNKSQWRVTENGGWELLTAGDKLIEGSTFTITRY